MKAILVTTLLVLAGLMPSDDTWKKDRAISSFSGLSVSSGIDVYLSQGNSEKLTFDVKGVNEEDVRSEVRNGVLKLYIERKRMGMNWGRNTYVKAYLTFRQLTDLQASGGSDVFGQGTLSFKDLNISGSGGSDVKLAVKADEINVSAAGGSDVVLEGTARSLNADGSGGSDLDARKLTVDVCNANSSGGSDVYVYATRELSLKASGGSDIYYYGSAKVLSKSESGGSDITHKN
ncbi:head GIN domain-containing protein [Spirosoma rigui]|uniref:head GIN domain-containing protein n=1 Tax=Spirosoma rigui TaxID=564064 RepID=UPI0009B0AC53|nr:head GIN domain-containing protein [Spirosoma rigui]